MSHFSSLYVGRQLSAIEHGCIASFIARGHTYTLFVYDQIAVPEGVRLGDAQSLMSRHERDEFFSIAPGRISQFANGFRYRLLHRFGGWWVDTDVACLSEDLPRAEIVIGRESDEYLCNAILKISSGHRLLEDAYDFWHANRHVDHWGYTGPKAITRLAIEHNLQKYFLPASYLYPIPWDEARILLDPSTYAQVEETMLRKPFLHVWLSGLRNLGVSRDTVPPPGSFLGRIMADTKLNFKSET